MNEIKYKYQPNFSRLLSYFINFFSIIRINFYCFHVKEMTGKLLGFIFVMGLYFKLRPLYTYIAYIDNVCVNVLCCTTFSFKYTLD